MYDDNRMDMKLREFLLILLDDLTDLDRCRLHFVLGNEVPRRFRESSNIKNTLRVFEYLIDSDKIFNCLIDALIALGKLGWSEKLKQFQKLSTMPMTHPLPQLPVNGTIGQSVLDDSPDGEDNSYSI